MAKVLKWLFILLILPFALAFIFNRFFWASENFAVGLMQVSGTMLTITVATATFGYNISRRLVEHWTNRLLGEEQDFEEIKKSAKTRISFWNNILRIIWLVAFYLFISVISSAFGAYRFKSDCIAQYLIAISLGSFVIGCIFIVYFQILLFIDVRKAFKFIENIPQRKKQSP